jgi:hypothetical protein
MRYLQAGMEVLEGYLLSPEIYWPVGIAAPPGETPYPQLTLGNISLARLRATAKATTLQEKEQLAQANEKVNATHQQWRVAWGNKALQEIRGRVTQWRNFVQDYRENSQANYDRYAYEISRRVIIQLLLPNADGCTSADQEIIRGLDGLLKTMLTPGDFIWDGDLKEAFAPDFYWYLYGRLPEVYPKDKL